MDELTCAEGDPDMRGTVAHRLEKDQIAGLHLIAMDLLSLVVLLACFTRERRSVLRENPLHEPAAIETS
jgi:hypothetical protein